MEESGESTGRLTHWLATFLHAIWGYKHIHTSYFFHSRTWETIWSLCFWFPVWRSLNVVSRRARVISGKWGKLAIDISNNTIVYSIIRGNELTDHRLVSFVDRCGHESQTRATCEWSTLVAQQPVFRIVNALWCPAAWPSIVKHVFTASWFAAVTS